MVSVSGEIDVANAQAFEEGIRAAVAGLPPVLLIVDLSHDSSGANGLVRAWNGSSERAAT